LDGLPPVVQRLARRSFHRLKTDERHPGLHFKRVGRMWSVRVGRSHRALGVDAPEGVLWFWIGTHAEYDLLTARQ
jgi:hypothetical protein